MRPPLPVCLAWHRHRLTAAGLYCDRCRREITEMSNGVTERPAWRGGLALLLRIAAGGCFLLAAVPVTPFGTDLVPVGLLLWLVSTLV